MMKKSILLVGVCLCVTIISCLILFRTTDAYMVGAGQNPPTITTGTVAGYVNQVQQLMNSRSPLPGAPSWLSGALNAISQWFQNIMAQGAQSTGAPIPITISGPLGSSISVSAQNLFTQFDAWLYSIIHFHVAFILNFIFGLIIWVLNMAKNAVDWLNSIFRSAAGK